MSPFALLTVACVASLLASSEADPRNIRNKCNTVTIGQISGDPISWFVGLRVGSKEQAIYIDDYCSVQKKALKGEQVTVCDSVAPLLTVPAWGEISPVAVTRQGSLDNPADAFITQFCL